LPKLGGDLGNGYVGLVHALLFAARPELRVRIRNLGISGNTLRDLDARWQSDVLDMKPDWLSIIIGINDVWRQFDAPLQTEWHVDLDAYASILEKLVRTTRRRFRCCLDRPSSYGVGFRPGASKLDGTHDSRAGFLEGVEVRLMHASLMDERE
jgi:lysophospholipase L1-like esterase